LSGLAGAFSFDSRGDFLDWSDPNQGVEGREDVLIALSPRDEVVMVKTISMPMRCSKK
jgi:hypothetical protein